MPVSTHRSGATHSDSPLLTPEELGLAVRNHGTPLEALRYSVTPIGMHYTLCHFDIPDVEPRRWSLEVGGRVRRQVVLSLEALQARPTVTLTVTLECAGNGRALLSPRPISQPWVLEAVGTAVWTGIPLWTLLKEAGILDGAIEVVFTGLDRGVRDGHEHAYAFSLPLGEALREEVILAHTMNGQPLPPQHGFPLRLVAPGWYGMVSVKWLNRITVVAEPFRGAEQDVYRIKQSEEDDGVPVTRVMVRSLMVPPGIPDFLTRRRFLAPGRHIVEGRAWSGHGAVRSVDVSADGGKTWHPAALGAAESPLAWRSWSHVWLAEPGEYELCCRASDDRGNTQPITQNWNVRGMANNAVQRVWVSVVT